MKYLVSVPAIYRENYEVEADSAEDAIQEIEDGNGTPVPGTLAFSSELDSMEATYIVFTDD